MQEQEKRLINNGLGGLYKEKTNAMFGGSGSGSHLQLTQKLSAPRVCTSSNMSASQPSIMSVASTPISLNVSHMSEKAAGTPTKS